MFKVMKENNQNVLVIILIVFSENLITIIIGVNKKFIIKITPDYSSMKKYSNSSNPI